jgi:phospholipid/cholesterol/gamma-HCH transport system permease protein
MLYCAFVGLMGSYWNVHTNELTSFITFFEKAFEQITFLDVISSVFKSFLYGFTIGIVGCYKGFNATQGTQGVGRAANASVVLSMFLIFVEEIIVVQVTNWLR